MGKKSAKHRRHNNKHTVYNKRGGMGVLNEESDDESQEKTVDDGSGVLANPIIQEKKDSPTSSQKIVVPPTDKILEDLWNGKHVAADQPKGMREKISDSKMEIGQIQGALKPPASKGEMVTFAENTILGEAIAEREGVDFEPDLLERILIQRSDTLRAEAFGCLTQCSSILTSKEALALIAKKNNDVAGEISASSSDDDYRTEYLKLNREKAAKAFEKYGVYARHGSKFFSEVCKKAAVETSSFTSAAAKAAVDRAPDVAAAGYTLATSTFGAVRRGTGAVLSEVCQMTNDISYARERLSARVWVPVGSLEGGSRSDESDDSDVACLCSRKVELDLVSKKVGGGSGTTKTSVSKIQTSVITGGRPSLLSGLDLDHLPIARLARRAESMDHPVYKHFLIRSFLNAHKYDEPIVLEMFEEALEGIKDFVELRGNNVSESIKFQIVSAMVLAIIDQYQPVHRESFNGACKIMNTSLLAAACRFSEKKYSMKTGQTFDPLIATQELKVYQARVLMYGDAARASSDSSIISEAESIVETANGIALDNKDKHTFTAGLSYRFKNLNITSIVEPKSDLYQEISHLIFSKIWLMFIIEKFYNAKPDKTFDKAFASIYIKSDRSEQRDAVKLTEIFKTITRDKSLLNDEYFDIFKAIEINPHNTEFIKQILIFWTLFTTLICQAVNSRDSPGKNDHIALDALEILDGIIFETLEGLLFRKNKVDPNIAEQTQNKVFEALNDQHCSLIDMVNALGLVDNCGVKSEEPLAEAQLTEWFSRCSPRVEPDTVSVDLRYIGQMDDSERKTKANLDWLQMVKDSHLDQDDGLWSQIGAISSKKRKWQDIFSDFWNLEHQQDDLKIDPDSPISTVTYGSDMEDIKQMCESPLSLEPDSFSAVVGVANFVADRIVDLSEQITGFIPISKRQKIRHDAQIAREAANAATLAAHNATDYSDTSSTTSDAAPSAKAAEAAAARATHLDEAVVRATHLDEAERDGTNLGEGSLETLFHQRIQRWIESGTDEDKPESDDSGDSSHGEGPGGGGKQSGGTGKATKFNTIKNAITQIIKKYPNGGFFMRLLKENLIIKACALSEIFLQKYKIIQKPDEQSIVTDQQKNNLPPAVKRNTAQQETILPQQPLVETKTATTLSGGSRKSKKRTASKSNRKKTKRRKSTKTKRRKKNKTKAKN
jgi:hypothetical protein